jgi:hypothetical protein
MFEIEKKKLQNKTHNSTELMVHGVSLSYLTSEILVYNCKVNIVIFTS